ncbi:MAG: hypothetical protein RL385_3206 [Pseudomonadota bacterium]|jgi:NAD+ diphosphatase
MHSFGERFVPSARFTRAAQPGVWFCFQKRALLVTEARVLPGSPEALGLSALRTQFLGELDGQPCFSAELAGDLEAPHAHAFLDLRALYGLLDEPLFWLAGRALQIMEWDRTHQYCGACGAPTEPHGSQRARVCTDPACAIDHYPRVSPAMIVAVERGPEILLARSHNFPTGIYSTLAGFVDPGETLEGCVHREVFEETGVRIQNLRYFSSQPWPFPNSLMLGFTADYAGGEIRLEEEEIEHAAFFHVDALPRLFPGRISMASQLIADFRKRNGRTA